MGTGALILGCVLDGVTGNNLRLGLVSAAQVPNNLEQRITDRGNKHPADAYIARNRRTALGGFDTSEEAKGGERRAIYGRVSREQSLAVEYQRSEIVSTRQIQLLSSSQDDYLRISEDI